jgi:hypothetical protein
MRAKSRVETLAVGPGRPGQAFRLRSNLFLPMPMEISGVVVAELRQPAFCEFACARSGPLRLR